MEKVYEVNRSSVEGVLGSTTHVYPYDKIQGIKKCNVGGLIKFLSTGIMVTYENEKGKVNKSRLSVTKRNNWLEFINGKLA